MKANLELIQIAGVIERCLVKVNPYPYNHEHSQYPSLDYEQFDHENQPEIVKDDSLVLGQEVYMEDYKEQKQWYCSLMKTWDNIPPKIDIGTKTRFIRIPNQTAKNSIKMDVHESYVVYEFNNVMGSSDHKALKELDFEGWRLNLFKTEKEAIQALIDDKFTHETYVILKEIHIR